MKVAGVDLAGSLGRDTGICLLEGKRITRWAVVHTDAEILVFLREKKLRLVAIDAPLHLPPGRKRIEDRNGDALDAVSGAIAIPYPA